MKNVKRYEIYIADLNPTIGGEIQKVRPVVVISQNELNKYLDSVVVCPLTSKLHPKWRSRIQIICEKKPAEIAIDQIRSISKQKLQRRIDNLSPDDALKLRLIITEMYGE
jgi:mRNA interferase MazF